MFMSILIEIFFPTYFFQMFFPKSFVIFFQCFFQEIFFSKIFFQKVFLQKSFYNFFPNFKEPTTPFFLTFLELLSVYRCLVLWVVISIYVIYPGHWSVFSSFISILHALLTNWPSSLSRVHQWSCRVFVFKYKISK